MTAPSSFICDGSCPCAATVRAEGAICSACVAGECPDVDDGVDQTLRRFQQRRGRR